MHWTKYHIELASFYQADLIGANLSGADLNEVRVNEYTVGFWPVPPETGDFIAYKKCAGGELITLFIPAEARRSSATSRKCRAEFAVVLGIESEYGRPIDSARSGYDAQFVYRVGETVHCHEWNPNRWVECGGGIHFYMSKAEAQAWR